MPPHLLEAFFAYWIPPACREEVLGDLAEEYFSPVQYIVLAVRTIPLVILSRARRVTEAPVLFMQALLVYAGYLAAGFYRDSALLHGPYGLLRAALPLVPFFLVMVACDVYFAPPKTASRMAGRVAVAALVSFLAMARFACGNNSGCLARTLPDWMNLLGSAAALLLVTALRVAFRSHPNLHQAAGPAHLLKQTAAPIALPRRALSALAIALGITAGAVTLLSIGLRPGGVGILIALVLLLGFGLHRPKKD